jgi:FtsZ-binding cell division protein ZapB
MTIKNPILFWDLDIAILNFNYKFVKNLLILNFMENNSPNRRSTVILIILVIILVGCVAVLYIQYNKMKTNSAIVQEALEEQKQSLTHELQDMMSEYEGLKSDNDSMNRQIDKQQIRIKQLLAINADNFEKIKIYKKELGTLRDIMKSYIVQIDSLNTKNQMLVAENTQVKGKLDEVKKSNENLSKEKEDLSSKVQMASILNAKNISVNTLNKRGKYTEKASKVTKIKVCFVIRENSIVTAGEKEVFMRIARPDELILVSSEQDLFTYEGKQIAFSAKRSVEYANKDVDLCIFWDNTGQLISGTYSVDLFSEGKLIGTTTFALK